jgi:hypothetical protein
LENIIPVMVGEPRVIVEGVDIKPRSILMNNKVDGKEEESDKKPAVSPSVLRGMVVTSPTPTNSNNKNVSRQEVGKKEASYSPMMIQYHANVNGCEKLYFGGTVSPEAVLNSSGSEERRGGRNGTRVEVMRETEEMKKVKV